MSYFEGTGFCAGTTNENRRFIEDIFRYFNIEEYTFGGWSEDLFRNYRDYRNDDCVWGGDYCELYAERPDFLEAAEECEMDDPESMFFLLNALFPGTNIYVQSWEGNDTSDTYETHNTVFDGKNYRYVTEDVYRDIGGGGWNGTKHSVGRYFPGWKNRHTIETLIEISTEYGNTQLTAILLDLLHRMDTGSEFTEKEQERQFRVRRSDLLNRIRYRRERAGRVSRRLERDFDALRLEARAAKTGEEIRTVYKKMWPMIESLDACIQSRRDLQEEILKLSVRQDERTELIRQAEEARDDETLQAVRGRIGFIQTLAQDTLLSRKEHDVLRGAALNAGEDEVKHLAMRLKTLQEQVRRERELSREKDLFRRNMENEFFEGSQALCEAARAATDIETLKALNRKRAAESAAASAHGFDRYPVLRSEGGVITFRDGDGEARVLNNAAGRFEVKNGTVRIFGSPRVFRKAA